MWVEIRILAIITSELGGNKFWSVTCSGVANKFTGVEEVKNQRLLDDLFRETSKFLTT